MKPRQTKEEKAARAYAKEHGAEIAFESWSSHDLIVARAPIIDERFTSWADTKTHSIHHPFDPHEKPAEVWKDLLDRMRAGYAFCAPGCEECPNE